MVNIPKNSPGANDIFRQIDRADFASATGYQIIKSCGRGSYGEVFLVCDNVGRLSALKLIGISSSVNKELEGIKNYAGCGDTPALIKIYHIGSYNDMLYYTMELADNLGDDAHYCPATLTNFMNKNGILPPRQAIEIMLRLLEGLEVMHGAGMVHRDIKPENIIFVHGQVKFSDVGLVRTYNNTLSLGGTPGFIPQERLTSSGKTKNPLDDLYAMGKVFYCMTTGKTADDYPSVPSEIFSKDFQSINQIILKACSINPKERFANCREFIEALQALQTAPAGKRKHTAFFTAALATAALAGGIAVYLTAPGNTASPSLAVQSVQPGTVPAPEENSLAQPGALPEDPMLRYPLKRQPDQSIILNSCDEKDHQEERLMTLASYRPPYTVKAVCMPHSKNLCFNLCEGQISFNDDSDVYYLRTDIVNIRANSPLERQGFLPPGKFAEITLTVQADTIEVLVNNEKRATFFGNFDFAAPVGLFTCRGGKLTVKSFSVQTPE